MKGETLEQGRQKSELCNHYLYFVRGTGNVQLFHMTILISSGDL